MKISAIQTYNQNKTTKFNTINKTQSIKSDAQINPDLLFKHLGRFGYGVISFGNSEFDKTVNANYFKLPSSANPDVFQKAAAQNILLDNDVLVTAPTGTGKTAIAHYAIGKNLRDGLKTFYTTPLKALSNEKFRDFQNIYGKENVGILTGDSKINRDAPIVIMTTEVYRNMILGEHFGEKNELLDDLKTVIFDELHYLGDVDRGGIWEQSLFLSRPETQLLSLSATIGNNEEIANWMAKIRDTDSPEIVSGNNKTLEKYEADKKLPVHSVLINVPSENRHVPLKFENIDVQEISPEPVKSGKKKSKYNEQINRLNLLAAKKGIIPAYSYRDVVVKLKDEDKLPAIFFVFDKKNSKDILEYLAKYAPHLTNDDEKEQIMDIVEKYEEDGKYLGETLDVKALIKGYALHNAGLLPNQKELIEELFQKKLVKVVIATETLSAGINMPTRTTVITATRKPSSNPDGPDNKRTITPNEFHQMAGRAGRRGIDKIGYCYTMSLDENERDAFDILVNSKPNNLKSALQPDYSFIAKYYKECQNDEMLNLLYDKSFFTYDKDEKISAKKREQLKSLFDQKITTMKHFGYLTNNKKLSSKGKLISFLNGYEQIPIIEMLTNKAFAKLSPAALAASVGALANLEPVKDGMFNKRNIQNGKKPVEWESTEVQGFITDLDNTIAEFNNFSIECNKKYHPIEANKELTNNIYKWAALNEENEDSVQNWSKLYYKSDKRFYKDEGTMFKSIMMTIDLLRQLRIVAEQGMIIANSSSDYNYYKELTTKIDEAIDLINKEPAIG